MRESHAAERRNGGKARPARCRSGKETADRNLAGSSARKKNLRDRAPAVFAPGRVALHSQDGARSARSADRIGSAERSSSSRRAIAVAARRARLRRPRLSRDPEEEEGTAWHEADSSRIARGWTIANPASSGDLRWIQPSPVRHSRRPGPQAAARRVAGAVAGRPERQRSTTSAGSAIWRQVRCPLTSTHAASSQPVARRKAGRCLSKEERGSLVVHHLSGIENLATCRAEADYMQLCDAPAEIPAHEESAPGRVSIAYPAGGGFDCGLAARAAGDMPTALKFRCAALPAPRGSARSPDATTSGRFSDESARRRAIGRCRLEAKEEYAENGTSTRQSGWNPPFPSRITMGS